MSDNWTPEQKAFHCDRGRGCRCLIPGEREQIEQQLAEQEAARAARAEQESPA